MSADWGTRLVRLAQGTLPFENGVTSVMRRNGNSRYVSEVPVVMPLRPLRHPRGYCQKWWSLGGVTIPNEVAPQRAAVIME